MARLEQRAEHSALVAAQREAAHRAASAELTVINEQVAALEERLETGSDARKAKHTEADRCAAAVEREETALRHLHAKHGHASHFKSRQERDQHLTEEIKELHASIRKKEEQAQALMSV